MKITSASGSSAVKSIDIAAFRLENQRLSESKLKTPGDVVARMGAMQAQDYEMAKWAIGLRLPGATIGRVQAALDRGEIIRTHLLRPTWHFVAAADYAWMLGLTGPRIRAVLRSRHRRMALTDAVIARSEAIFARVMGSGKFAGREALLAALEKAGIATGGNRGWHIFLRAELDGILCSGPDISGRWTYALSADRVPITKSLPKGEALAALAKRYFASRGPATLQDFVWWSGLAAGEAKQALESVKDELDSAEIGERIYWSGDSGAPPAKKRGSAHLLPAYDEFLIGYRDRSPALSVDARKTAISSNGFFRPVILVDGRAAGIWKRTINGDDILVEASLFRTFGKDDRRLVETAVRKYGRFLGKTADLILK
jgi:hypothetical protein